METIEELKENNGTNNSLIIKEKFSVNNSAKIWKIIFDCLDNKIEYAKAFEQNRKLL